MQVFGGASDSVPAVRTPGVPSPNAPMFTELSGSTVGVVLGSSWAAAGFSVRSFGNVVALSSPGGAHWFLSATAGAANLTDVRPQTIRMAATNETSLAPRLALKLITATVATDGWIEPFRARWMARRAPRRVQ